MERAGTSETSETFSAIYVTSAQKKPKKITGLHGMQ
jgi:hypothetical protein